MSHLYLTLPSFATDYSGFFSVMYGLGGLMILHDPSGCMGNYTNCDEPRWYDDPQPYFTTTLSELEAVTGETETVVAKIVSEAKRMKPPFICILSTPVPSLTGCDIDAIAEAVGEQTGIKAFGIPTTGFKFYNDGQKRAYRLLFDEFIDKDAKIAPGTVNLLGMTALDYFTGGEDEAMRSMVETMGFKVNAVIGLERDISKIKAAGSAEKNIVMSAAALPLAERLQAEFGTPYRVGPPCGEGGKRALQAFLTGEYPSEQKPATSSGKSVLIIGEQACSNALRAHLKNDCGYSLIDVATFFEFSRALSAEGDKPLRSETELKELLASLRYDTVIGDPLFEPLCPRETRFIARPHPAVSSKLHWKEYVSILG